MRNDANEMTNMTEGGTVTSFSYDDWGRTVSKYTASYSTNYHYHYGDKLTKFTSTFPGEGTVNFEYGGDGKRRYRDVSGGAYTWYNWDLGWTVLNEENEGTSKTAGDGSLSRTYVNAFPIQEVGQVLAHFDGTSPADSDYRYYLQDNIRSTRNLFNHSKSEVANYAYTPYGEVFANHGASSTSRLFTGHAWGQSEAMYFAPYRYYNAGVGRSRLHLPRRFLNHPAPPWRLAGQTSRRRRMSRARGATGPKATVLRAEGLRHHSLGRQPQVMKPPNNKKG